MECDQAYLSLFCVTSRDCFNKIISSEEKSTIHQKPASNVYWRHISFVMHISVIQHEHYYFFYKIICYYYQYIIIHLFIGITVT